MVVVRWCVDVCDCVCEVLMLVMPVCVCVCEVLTFDDVCVCVSGDPCAGTAGGTGSSQTSHEYGPGPGQ